MALPYNRVVVAHKKLGGQRLRLLNHEMWQSWVVSLCEKFSSNGTERYYQGDGNAPVEISWDGASGGVLAHAFTDGTIATADQLFKFYLYNIKAQMQAGLHLTSDDNRAKEVQLNNLLNSINRVTSSKLFLLHLVFIFLILIFKLHFISTFPFYRFIC
jgi:hypothetical protein